MTTSTRRQRIQSPKYIDAKTGKAIKPSLVPADAIVFKQLRLFKGYDWLVFLPKHPAKKVTPKEESVRVEPDTLEW